MTTEKLIRWTPLDGVKEKHNLEYFSAHATSLDLILKEMLLPDTDVSERRIKISFENSVIMHRITHESLRISSDNVVTDSDGHPIWTWTFYTISNSQLIRQFLSEVEKLPQSSPLSHFICGDIESYIEIIATKAPKAEWIKHAVE